MDIYKDTTKTIEERVKDLLSIMTVKEKVGQLNQNMLGWNGFKIVNGDVEFTEEFKNEVAFGDGLGAIYGVSRADGWNSNVTMGIKVEDSVKVANAIQKYVIDNTRLKIPVFLSEECPHGHEALEATTFPTNIGTGSTWNPDLYEKMCEVIREELRARGGHLALVSTLDIATDPRWGRTEECYGEDPYLGSEFCKKAVTGIQGETEDELEENAIVVLKHFCAQGATIGGHNGKSTNIGQRELYEIHLQGMRKGAKAGALGCMAAYNDIDGIPCHINHKLLTNILRDEMGFKGFVMSDGKGADRLTEITGTFEKAGAGAVHAGVDLNLWNTAFLKLEDAVNNGLLSMEDLDLAVSRVLSAKFKMGLFENPFIDDKKAKAVVGSEKSKAVALEAARESVVLLKNENVLPIKKNVKNIAVIGPNADKMYNQLGDYTQWQEKGKVITVLEGIKNNAPDGVNITYSHGCSIRGNEKNEFNEAICNAKKSDVIVLVLGGSSTREASMTFEDNGALFMDQFTTEIDCGEAVDLADIKLGGVQEELAKELKKLGKPIITVLIEGRPHAIPWFKENVEGILCGWYPGEQGGQAIGEILFGKTNPSGKLSISMPRDAAQLPVYYNCKTSTKYVDMDSKPLYSFGYGLSYTNFILSNFNIEKEAISKKAIEDGERFKVNFNILNSGECFGKEVLQLYIFDMESCITRRLKELKDFTKVSLDKGESKNITLSVGKDELGVYNYDMEYVIEPGKVKLMVGNSSDNIVFEKIVEIL